MYFPASVFVIAFSFYWTSCHFLFLDSSIGFILARQFMRLQLNLTASRHSLGRFIGYNRNPQINVFRHGAVTSLFVRVDRKTNLIHRLPRWFCGLSSSSLSPASSLLPAWFRCWSSTVFVSAEMGKRPHDDDSGGESDDEQAGGSVGGWQFYVCS